MPAVPKLDYLTPEEYLAIERHAEYKSEYVDGVMYAMAGGSPRHNLVSGSIHTLINVHLWESPCKVFNSEMKVRVPSSRKYHYPDVTIVCEKPEYADDEKDVLLNPLLIVEVLSKSTQGYDKGKKFLYYQEIDSFREYLLVAQDQPVVQHYVRQPDGSWIYKKIEGMEQGVQLATINFQLKLKDIYVKALD